MHRRAARESMKFFTLAGVAFAALWTAMSAAAAERSAIQACRADAAALCAGVQPGGGRIAACLRENEAKVSEGCKARLGQIEACAAELRKACPQAEGETALRTCTKDKRSEISAGCRAAAGP